MKHTKVQDDVLGFIKNNPASSVEAIVVGTKGSDISVRGAIKSLLTEEIITTDPDTGSYSIREKPKESPTASTSKPNGKKVDSKATKKNEDNDLGPKTFTGRDNSKFRFLEHRNLPKGRLVLLLVKTYVEKNPKVSLVKLQELFHSEDLQPRFGVICELSAAKKFSKNNVDRHFIKNADDIIKVGDKRVAICNQWTAEGIQKLLKIVAAQPFGYKVKVEEAAE
jgi:hypothetical protein